MKNPFHEILSNQEVAIKVISGALRLPKPTRIEVPYTLSEIMQQCSIGNPSLRPTFLQIYEYLQKGITEPLEKNNIIQNEKKGIEGYSLSNNLVEPLPSPKRKWWQRK